MIENYVHWNEDIGEWQLVRVVAWLVYKLMLVWASEEFHWAQEEAGEAVSQFHYAQWTLLTNLFFCLQKCVAYTGNNMRKQTPVLDKKEKDVSDCWINWTVQAQVLPEIAALCFEPNSPMSIFFSFEDMSLWVSWKQHWWVYKIILMTLSYEIFLVFF